MARPYQIAIERDYNIIDGKTVMKVAAWLFILCMIQMSCRLISNLCKPEEEEDSFRFEMSTATTRSSSSSSSSTLNRDYSSRWKRPEIQIPAKKTYKPEMEIQGTECTVCLGEFMAGEEVRVLPKCKHGFHLKCIDKWIVKSSTCPTCRTTL
ncbi:RING-H2 finger protein ATL73-like [Impatiens glandulifera]|uniref:RING-H2 finger protein ATL73-like n=1 Tax=Impatiens glandulifera TaxID=253017 RepID=UPI001FB09A25|nr:RING-H2 finger protein ATL73-like [Impatiens glandulifera]